MATVLILLVRLVEEIGPEREPGDRFRVIRILDGDTMELLGGDRLRLLAVDAPEAGEPLYKEAIQLLESLALGKTVGIEYSGRRRDRYGRLLGFAYVDSLYINKELIEEGLGYIYLFRDTRLASVHVKDLLAAQRRAIEARRGLWALERIPESHYVARSGSFRLHRPGCRSVQNLVETEYRRFTTREEGLATGLSPCRNCKP
ncbi:MAG: thermonuclease family protein [Candidatus Zixiibacteriota bacterium]|nr:MAG: thermonuclease family protein [candidate division Zixibacteria bacterium]